MAVRAPYLPYEKLKKVAEKFLAEHHPDGSLPVPIEEIIEFKLGLDIVPVPSLQKTFEVDAFITHDLTAIHVDQFTMERRLARYRFSLAHEVAHTVVHREVFAEIRFSNVSEWKKAICGIDRVQYQLIEQQAYALGGLLLVPPRPLCELFEEKAQEASAAGLKLCELDRPTRRSVASHIGKYFGVSAEVIDRRAQREGLWR
jgi:Zn-dependent peptidase ImmA (M78 family)